MNVFSSLVPFTPRTSSKHPRCACLNRFLSWCISPKSIGVFCPRIRHGALNASIGSRLGPFFELSYLVIRLSDCNDSQRTNGSADRPGHEHVLIPRAPRTRLITRLSATNRPRKIGTTGCVGRPVVRAPPPAITDISLCMHQRRPTRCGMVRVVFFMNECRCLYPRCDSYKLNERTLVSRVVAVVFVVGQTCCRV
jgi:hypothetical protein